MRVSELDDGLGVKLPDDVVRQLGLKPGDEIDVVAAGAAQIAVAGSGDRQAALERLREFRGMIPADFKFDRDEANAR